jgi:hypothetical protein
VSLLLGQDYSEWRGFYQATKEGDIPGQWHLTEDDKIGFKKTEHSSRIESQ